MQNRGQESIACLLCEASPSFRPAPGSQGPTAEMLPRGNYREGAGEAEGLRLALAAPWAGGQCRMSVSCSHAETSAALPARASTLPRSTWAMEELLHPSREE